MAGFPPLTSQGTLNRVLTHVILPLFPQLSVTAPYMAKSQAVLTLEGPFVDQIGTATDIVNSPHPYVMGQVVISILRSQAVAGFWVAQAQSASVVGPVQTYADTITMPAITLANCSIHDIDPGAYDGADPTTKVTLKGVFYTNAQLWADL